MKNYARSSTSVNSLFSIAFLLLLFSFVPGISQAQTDPPPLINSTLAGTVLDARTKETMVGVTVQLKGTTHVASTDNKGRFNFVTGQKFPYVLIISYTGYEKVEVVANGSPVEILLKEDIKALNEIVVVGYGTQDKKSIIGSVSSIKASDIANKPVASFDQQIQGKAAGVQVASNTGIPGDGIFFRIRGTTSINASSDPLFVVDGVFINNESLQKITTQGQSNNPLADINPADIESISILKDAEATAIYGARAANGVVLITTKRGTYNSKPKISFNTYLGKSKTPKLWSLLTGPEHATIINETWTNDGKPFATRPFRLKSEGGRGLPEEQQTYDRLNDIFRTGTIQNYDLSIAGGNDKTRYYIGGGYTSQEANIKTNDFSRASFKINLDQKINSAIRIGSSNILSRSSRSNARVGDGPQGGIFQAALHTPTYLPKFNDDGTYAKWAGFDNLDVLINNTDMNSTSIRYIGNIYAEADLSKDLKFRSSWSVDYNNYDEFEYWNSFTNRGSANKNLATSSVSQNNIWTNEQTLSYKKLFADKHTFGALLGNTIQGSVATQTFAQGTNFPGDDFKQIASAATTTASSNQIENNLLSFFSRVDYNYASKYFVEFSLRADGSSRFGKDKKWGYFPSAGLSWRLKEENFLKNSEQISELKIRGSIGLTGNQNGIGNYAALGLWQGGANYLNNPGITPVQLANTNLGWESTRQLNLGLDLGLFKDRIGLEFNAYSKYTYDLLLNNPLAPSTGFTSITKNTGEISNKGLELGINTTNIISKDFKWQTNFNLAKNVNKIEKLSTPIDASYSTIRMVEGSPMFSFYVYKQLYVDPQTGDAVYEDLNNDGQITVADKQIVGNASPKLFGGINNSFSYKGIDLSVFFNFQYGNKIYNNNRFFLESGGTRDDRRAINKNQLNRWQKPGDITDVPRLTTVGNNYNLSPTSRFVEDGSFIRLSTVNLGYTLPKFIAEKVKASSLRVYFTGTNLALWTKYSGPDPEINVTSDPLVQGYDLGTPPLSRTLQFGLNVTL